jgi:hypothetical protein
VCVLLLHPCLLGGPEACFGPRLTSSMDVHWLAVMRRVLCCYAIQVASGGLAGVKCSRVDLLPVAGVCCGVT